MIDDSSDRVAANEHPSILGMFVGTLQLLDVQIQTSGPIADSSAPVICDIKVRNAHGQTQSFSGSGTELNGAIISSLRAVATHDFELSIERHEQGDQLQWIAIVSAKTLKGERSGIGKFVTNDETLGSVMASLRGIQNAGMLASGYRANNQKQLRSAALQTLRELVETLDVRDLSRRKEHELEGILFDQLNRVATAAVLTATNTKKSTSALTLYDTSAWLYDASGARRDSFTDTDHWLAWYPGLSNGHLTIQDVMDTLPAAGPMDIPWIVRLLENPESWIRFRGAVSLEDHDVLHILLGRGLQDQDEAFVVGFAMGTAKRASWFQKRVLRWVLSRLYPEPYRVPTNLLPAFDLGVECGMKTGCKDLYKMSLHELVSLPLTEARAQCGIQLSVLQEFYRLEQEIIPMTIASVRLPVAVIA